MTTEKVKICFVGAGKHAQANLYPSVRALGYEIAALATQSATTARAAGVSLGIANTYGDVAAMLEAEAPTHVIVSADPHGQSSIAELCLEKAGAVFVEKPMGWTVSDAERVANVAAEKGSLAMVGFMKRYAPVYQKLKSFVDEGSEYGDLTHVHATFGVRSFGNDPETYIKFSAIHFLDLLRWLLGDIGDISGVQKIVDSGVHFSVVGASVSGVTFSLNLVGLPSWGRHYEEVVASRENAYAVAENLRKFRLHIERPSVAGKPRWQVPDEIEESASFIDSSSAGGLQALYVNGFVGELDYFLNSLSSRSSEYPSAVDNVDTTRLCQRVLELPNV